MFQHRHLLLAIAVIINIMLSDHNGDATGVLVVGAVCGRQDRVAGYQAATTQRTTPTLAQL